jgi:hypothetical protein
LLFLRLLLCLLLALVFLLLYRVSAARKSAKESAHGTTLRFTFGAHRAPEQSSREQRSKDLAGRLLDRFSRVGVALLTEKKRSDLSKRMMPRGNRLLWRWRLWLSLLLRLLGRLSLRGRRLPWPRRGSRLTGKSLAWCLNGIWHERETSKGVAAEESKGKKMKRRRSGR